MSTCMVVSNPVSRVKLSAILVVVLAIFGCQRQADKQPGLSPKRQADSESPTEQIDGDRRVPLQNALASDIEASVRLLEGDSQTFTQMLRGHQGKVVLVDFWATWCGPCVKQFPHTVELSRKHRQEGLAVITVSMNEPKDQESVLAFLRRQKADIDNLLPKYGAGSQFLEAFDLRGDVPFYKLYDRQGKLRYTFSSDPEGIENCEPIEKIDQRVVELLATNP